MPASIKNSRLNAFINQAGLCYYCKSAMWLKDVESFATKHSILISDAARFQCTAEHLTARCDGGSNRQDNIVAACIFCNKKRHQTKAPRTPSKHKKHIQKRITKGKWHPQKLLHLVSMPTAIDLSL